MAGPVFNSENQALHAEIRDLKQQLSSFVTMFASSQASMFAQMGGLSTQGPSCIRRPRTPAKPSLKLSLG